MEGIWGEGEGGRFLAPVYDKAGDVLDGLDDVLDSTVVREWPGSF
jgi:hypothetical protein